MRRAQLLFLAALAVAAGAILARSSASFRLDHWPELLVLSALIYGSTLVSLGDLGSGDLNWEAGAIVCALLVAGPDVALCAVAGAQVVERLTRRGSVSGLVFNLAQLTVAGWASFQAYTLLGGQWGQAFAHPVQAVVLAAIFMGANTLLYGAYLHVSGAQAFRTAMRTLLEPSTLRTYLVITMVGLFTGAGYIFGGVLFAAVGLGFAWMLQQTMRRYFDSVSEARYKAQQLEVVLNATHSAILVKDPQGLIQMANRKVAAMFGLDPGQLAGKCGSQFPGLPLAASAQQPAEQQSEQILEIDRGGPRFIHAYRSALHAPDGDLLGQIEIFTDVTELKEAEQRLRRLYDSTISALTAAIDARDSYTRGHSERVSAYAVALARQMALPVRDLERIRYAGLLHDIGKLGVDDEVLRKTGPLTPAERAKMMQHPVIGADVLAKAGMMADLIPGVRWHHEWFAGGGYPDGLAGEDIPLDARIIGVADALDAITTDRPYRPALSATEALERILEATPAQFDPRVVEALAAAARSGELAIGPCEAEPVATDDPETDGVIRPVHGKELLVLAQLSREDYTGSSMTAMLERYLRTFYETIGAATYQVYLLAKDTGAAELAASFGMAQPDWAEGKDLCYVREALKRGAPVVVNDLSRRGDYRPASPATKSEAVFPLTGQDGTIGALVVEAVHPYAFQSDDVYLFETLAQRLSSAVRLLRYHEQLTFAAWHDGATGAYNHGYFYEHLTQEVKRAAAARSHVSIVLLDINGLKALNDTFGHMVGDSALREYAHILQAGVRETDIVARYGGDEFAIILPGLSREEALTMVYRLMVRMKGTFTHQNLILPLPTAAWGIATYPDDGVRPAELVLVADGAMYSGKTDRRAHSCPGLVAL